MYSGALYIVPIVVFSVLYNINKFYEVNTAFLLDEMNNTVGTTGVSYPHKEMARSGIRSRFFLEGSIRIRVIFTWIRWIQ